MTDLRSLDDDDGGELNFINIVHHDSTFASTCGFFVVGFKVPPEFVFGLALRVSLGLVQGSFRV